MNSIFHFFSVSLRGFNRALETVSPLFQLATRLYIANIFFRSGLTKIRDLSSTIALFENEYKVPFLSPEFAAYSGTTAELVLPVLFVLGILSRPVAAALFILNLVAVLSYPDISDIGRADHMLWGALILVTVFFGAGKISVDHWITSREKQ